MKKVLSRYLNISALIFLFCFSVINSFSQRKEITVPSIIPPGGGGGPVNDDSSSIVPFTCNLSNTNPCNLIRNNAFLLSCTNTHAPFINCVDYWTSSHGTPQLNKNLPQIFPNVNHASMFADIIDDGNGNLTTFGEGIAVGIPALTSGSTYSLSLFKRFFSVGAYGGPDIDDFYVVLLKCNIFNSIRRYGEDYTIPAIPTIGAQVIYHETDVNNTSWQSITQSFVANDSYNVVWIFPKLTTTIPGIPPGLALESWLEVAYPEIKDIAICVPPPCTNPTITPSGPIDYHYLWESQWIGKSLSSSALTGNQWYKNGTAIPNANAPIYIAKEAGNYYTKVGSCTSNTVSITGYPYFASPPQFGQHIIPVQSSGYYCLNTNAPIQQFNLGSSAIYTWNTNPYPWVPSSLSINPSSYNIHSPNATLVIGNIGGTFDIQGTADLNGTEKVLDYTLLLTQQSTPQNLTVCASTIKYFGPPATYGALPGSSGFTSEFYDFGATGTIVSPTIYAGLHQVTIPGNSPLSNYIGVQFSGNSYVKFEASYSWGGCYSETLWNVTTLSGCFAGGSNSNSQSSSLIYPNPASNQLTISSTERIIKGVEIFGLFNNSILKVSGNNAKRLNTNISSLQPGVYNCRITTDKGIENQKLIIKR